MQIRILAVGLALTALPATAQPGSSQSAATPLRSAFAGYQAWREPEPLDWRSANRTAGDLGGHMGQLRSQGRSDSAPANIAPTTSRLPPQSAPSPPQPGAAKP